MATYARMESTGWVSVILADRDELYSNAISLMRLARSFTVFYLMVLIAGNLPIYAFIIKPLGRLSARLAGRFSGDPDPARRQRDPTTDREL